MPLLKLKLENSLKHSVFRIIFLNVIDPINNPVGKADRPKNVPNSLNSHQLSLSLGLFILIRIPPMIFLKIT